MRFKPVAIDKIERIDSTINKLTITINRNNPNTEILDNLTLLKEQLDDLRSMISIEHDEFEPR